MSSMKTVKQKNLLPLQKNSKKIQRVSKTPNAFEKLVNTKKNSLEKITSEVSIYFAFLL